jgi:hypothetical protein
MKKNCAAVLVALTAMCVHVGAQNLPVATPAPFSLMRCTSLPLPREMHGAAVVGARLYVMGGIPNLGGWTTSVISAPIMQGGALGTWREETPLPDMRSYISQSVEVVNDRIYIIGGGAGGHHQHARESAWARQ